MRILIVEDDLLGMKYLRSILEPFGQCAMAANGKEAVQAYCLAVEESAPFDLIFIDADKPSNAAYLDWAVRLSRPGTVIVCDNVIRNGAVTDALSNDGSVQGSRSAFDFLHSHPRLSATALQTVGAKGYDGFAIGIVGA